MYQSKLNLIDTEIAIKTLKMVFESSLTDQLNLLRVSAPVFLEANTGLNDDLCGNENPISFTVSNQQIELVHSLAKWKRFALYKYEIQKNSGIYTDMNAVRSCEKRDNTHSFYVDLWDWEKVISIEDRNMDTLISAVKKVYNCILDTEQVICKKYPQLKLKLPTEITIVSTQELEDMFPSLTPDEREYEITTMHKAVFITQIGGLLKSGNMHRYKAPDYDDWSLNGTMLFYHEPLNQVLSISSMGIRVDIDILNKQLIATDTVVRSELNFHKMIFNELLPLSIGGGLGQSRLSMFLLEKIHIGEVQVSVWSEDTIKNCAGERIFLL